MCISLLAPGVLCLDNISIPTGQPTVSWDDPVQFLSYVPLKNGTGAAFYLKSIYTFFSHSEQVNEENMLYNSDEYGNPAKIF